MKQHNERLKTYQPSILQTMCAAADANEHAHSRARSAPTAHEQPLGSTWEARKRAQQAAREAQARSKAEAFKAAMQHKQAHDAEQHEHEFQVLYKDVLNGLMHGGGILTDVQEMLNHANAVRKSRQAELYKQWSTEVFDKIQDRIRQGMLQSSIKQLEASLQSTSADYLHATNSKLGVFRAVHIGSDYNPLQPLANSICIKTGDIVDPLKRDLLKAQAESALLASAAQPRYCNSASSSSAGSGSNRLARAIVRQTLETQRWAAGQINATPYGHCIDETGSYAVKPPSAQDLANKASHLYMDDFSRPPAPDVYRPGKHVAPHADKGTAFFDIMQARWMPMTFEVLHLKQTSGSCG
eukprot:GHRR01025368.1.p1 GENE.GHRR01025368.1~~GHRR01025368.1.p1  ORF type:complete len:354 (+),score=124.04 GHRR01025368.1:1552-2613(+)